MQVPGFEEGDGDEAAAPGTDEPPGDATRPDPGPVSTCGGGGYEVPPRCSIPAKVLRQMRAAWVPAAGSVSVGIECVWTSRGAMAAGNGASIWALDLSLQVRPKRA
jgi:hypothetical protein